MKRVACYVRVSTEEQKNKGLSVDNQIQALSDYCKENDYTIAGIYNDAGISARKRYTKRPALLNLIEDCKAGKIDLIIFTKLDRWFRSVGDYYEVQRQLDLYKIPWRSIWEDYETETSSGVFKVNIMLSVAQSEADRTSERIRNTFDYKRAKGDYIGQAPIGYKRENNQLVKDPDTAPFVEIIFDTYLKTHSMAKARKSVAEAGRIMSKSAVEKVLRIETYAGNAYGYKCEPYITMDTYEEIQRIKDSNYRSPKVKCNAMFSSIVYCGICGKRMRAINTKAKGVYYPNYYCRGINLESNHNYGITLSQKKIEKYLLSELDRLIGEYNIEATNQIYSNDQIEIENKKKALEAKIDRIGIRFEEGDISAEEYKEKRKAIQQEIASLPSCKRLEKIELPDSWQEIYGSLDFDHKQSFWFSIIKQIIVNRDPDGYSLRIIFKD